MKQGIPRNLFLFLAAAVLLFWLHWSFSTAAPAASSQSEPASDLPAITVGIDNYPPFSYTSQNGTPTGIDIDLATEAFHRMGYQPEFVTIDWEEKQTLVESGAIDCIWSSFSIDGREDDYRWAGPYMVSRQVVVVRSDSDIHALADLAGRTVAVQSTTKPETLFLAHDNDAIPPLKNLICLQDRELIYTFLGKGYVDAVAAHEIAVLQYLKDYGLSFRILDEPLQTVGLGVAFAKNDTRGIAEELGQTLAKMRKDGTAREILGRYVTDPDRFLEVGQ